MIIAYGGYITPPPKPGHKWLPHMERYYYAKYIKGLAATLETSSNTT